MSETTSDQQITRETIRHVRIPLSSQMIGELFIQQANIKLINENNIISGIRFGIEGAGPQSAESESLGRA